MCVCVCVCVCTCACACACVYACVCVLPQVPGRLYPIVLEYVPVPTSQLGPRVRLLFEASLLLLLFILFVCLCDVIG